MKKGFIYVEALVASIITIIMIVSISKLVMSSKSNIEYSSEYTKGSNIVRSVSSIYRDGYDILMDNNGIYVNVPDDVYNYVLKGIKLTEGNYKIYCNNGFEEGIKHLKISLSFVESDIDTINEVVAK